MEDGRVEIGRQVSRGRRTGHFPTQVLLRRRTAGVTPLCASFVLQARQAEQAPGQPLPSFRGRRRVSEARPRQLRLTSAEQRISMLDAPTQTSLSSVSLWLSLALSVRLSPSRLCPRKMNYTTAAIAEMIQNKSPGS